MSNLTLNIDVTDKKILVVGAGEVAARKIKKIIETKAKLFVVSPEATEYIKELSAKNKIVYTKVCYNKEFITDDLFLVIAATNDKELNEQIFKNAKEKNILVNVITSRELGDCSFPAILKKEHIEIAVSTNKISPKLAVSIRDKIAGFIK